MSSRDAKGLTPRRATLALAACGWLICFGAMVYYDRLQHRHWPVGAELLELAVMSVFFGPLLAALAAWHAGVLSVSERVGNAVKWTLFVGLLALIGFAVYTGV